MGPPRGEKAQLMSASEDDPPWSDLALKSSRKHGLSRLAFIGSPPGRSADRCCLPRRSKNLETLEVPGRSSASISIATISHRLRKSPSTRHRAISDYRKDIPPDGRRALHGQPYAPRWMRSLTMDARARSITGLDCRGGRDLPIEARYLGRRCKPAPPKSSRCKFREPTRRKKFAGRDHLGHRLDCGYRALDRVEIEIIPTGRAFFSAAAGAADQVGPFAAG